MRQQLNRHRREAQVSVSKQLFQCNENILIEANYLHFENQKVGLGNLVRLILVLEVECKEDWDS